MRGLGPGLVAIALVLAGCASTPEGPAVTTNASGLQVFDDPTEIEGVPVVCNAFVLPDPVEGILRVTPDEEEAVWLEAPDGRRLSIAWPSGFTLRLDPSPAVFHDAGEEIAVADELLRFGQTDPDGAAGSPTDPYLLTRCSLEMTQRVQP